MPQRINPKRGVRLRASDDCHQTQRSYVEYILPDSLQGNSAINGSRNCIGLGNDGLQGETLAPLVIEQKG